MHEFKVYFVHVKAPMLVRGVTYTEAEKTAMEREKFHEISRIVRDDDPKYKDL